MNILFKILNFFFGILGLLIGTGFAISKYAILPAWIFFVCGTILLLSGFPLKKYFLETMHKVL